VGTEASSSSPVGAPPRVLLVDDHDFFRQGLRRLLAEHGIEDIVESASGDDAVARVADLAPDVVIMDLNMPGLSGADATRRLSELVPGARVLVLTVSDDERDVFEAIAAGANGYLLKSASPDQIVAGVLAAATGESLVSPRIATMLVEQLRREDSRGGAATIQAALSERELEVLKLLGDGRENSEIAEALFISPRTVKNHIANILEKLHMENRIQAAVYAARSGLLGARVSEPGDEQG
jgi:DNA-binding NarL/FixJ family response regulator